MPGRNTSTSPGSSRRASVTAEPTACSRRSWRWRGRQRTSTGWVRPSPTTTGAGSPSTASRRANSAVSAVADIAAIRRSGRSGAASRRRARPRSVVRLRSCTSSNRTAAMPGSSGSRWRRRVRIPSVHHLDARRRPDPALVPGLVPDQLADGVPVRSAIRRAVARVASRRGSSITMRPSPRHASSSSASGTTVDLPAPGGADRTTRPGTRERGPDGRRGPRRSGGRGAGTRAGFAGGVSRARASRGTAPDPRPWGCPAGATRSRR